MASADPLPHGRPRTYGPSPQLSDRLRDARMARGLSLRKLAARVGVSASLISQIETGKVQPSVNTLYALASELGLSIDDLLDATGEEWADADRKARRPGDGRAALVQRPDDRKIIRLSDGVRWERLTEHSQPGIDFLYMVYESGGESCPPGELHRHSGREWGYVICGTLVVELGSEQHELAPGDSIVFDSTTPHRLHNPGAERMEGIWFVLGRQGDPRLSPDGPDGSFPPRG
jgi:transcriptional regulator with XRE-family HTH domain